MGEKLRELWTDFWRVNKLMAAVIAGPLVLYLLLLWAGVFK